MIVDWGYNAWGDKYPPYDLDDVIPTQIANHYQYSGSSIQALSWKEALWSSMERVLYLLPRACLLNPNRNPHLNQKQIEEYLYQLLRS
jgi:agmatine deiminase